MLCGHFPGDRYAILAFHAIAAAKTAGNRRRATITMIVFLVAWHENMVEAVLWLHDGFTCSAER